MEELSRDAPDELAALTRLAEVYKRWAANRPPVMPSSDRDIKATMERLRLHQATQQPPDVERMIKARTEPLEALLRAELAVVGWRLYAKGGCDLMSALYFKAERDYHPGFIGMLRGSWRGIGFPEDPRGVWETIKLL